MVMELPRYRIPHLKQALLSMIEKVKMFIFDAGKIILALSVLLWALASFGPSDEMEQAVAQVHVPVVNQVDSIAVYNNQVTQLKLEHSYIGNIGKWIEPVIEPLGFDWKMGIAIVTSFAAREVFVGSMATIYSVGIDYNDERTLIERLRAEKESATGNMKYNLATGLSLMVFYVFAMQCLATFAVVKRETGTWKWPIVQVVYLGVLAYVFSFLVYHLFQ
jgi:ferrous iron transport protein B